MTPEERKQELIGLNARLTHALQCAVGYDKNMTGPEGEKHIRTGLNILFSCDKAVANLLILKGIISEIEYIEACNDALKDEIARYKDLYPGISFEGF